VDLEHRISESFSRIAVKPPFSTAPHLRRYKPTGAQILQVLARLREILTDGELSALYDTEFDMRIKQVWELVRWIHTEDEHSQVELETSNDGTGARRGNSP
jgi:hypothetical protein